MSELEVVQPVDTAPVYAVMTTEELYETITTKAVESRDAAYESAKIAAELANRIPATDPEGIALRFMAVQHSSEAGFDDYSDILAVRYMSEPGAQKELVRDIRSLFGNGYTFPGAVNAGMTVPAEEPYMSDKEVMILGAAGGLPIGMLIGFVKSEYGREQRIRDNIDIQWGKLEGENRSYTTTRDFLTTQNSTSPDTLAVIDKKIEANKQQIATLIAKRPPLSPHKLIEPTFAYGVDFAFVCGVGAAVLRRLFQRRSGA